MYNNRARYWSLKNLSLTELVVNIGMGYFLWGSINLIQKIGHMNASNRFTEES